jgi:hypothetical protein
MLCGSNASGFVAINALVLSGLATLRLVGGPEVIRASQGVHGKTVSLYERDPRDLRELYAKQLGIDKRRVSLPAAIKK